VDKIKRSILNIAPTLTRWVNEIKLMQLKLLSVTSGKRHGWYEYQGMRVRKPLVATVNSKDGHLYLDRVFMVSVTIIGCLLTLSLYFYGFTGRWPWQMF